MAASPLILLALGCAQDDCALESTVPDYEPACEAELLLWPEESRLRVDGRLEALLPADPVDGVYGGTSGNPLTLLFDGELAEARTARVVLADGLTRARIEGEFPAGAVEGLLVLE